MISCKRGAVRVSKFEKKYQTRYLFDFDTNRSSCIARKTQHCDGALHAHLDLFRTITLDNRADQRSLVAPPHVITQLQTISELRPKWP